MELKNALPSFNTLNTYAYPSKLNLRHHNMTPARVDSNAVDVDTTMTFHIGKNISMNTIAKNTKFITFCETVNSFANGLRFLPSINSLHRLLLIKGFIILSQPADNSRYYKSRHKHYRRSCSSNPYLKINNTFS